MTPKELKDKKEQLRYSMGDEAFERYLGEAKSFFELNKKKTLRR